MDGRGVSPAANTLADEPALRTQWPIIRRTRSIGIMGIAGVPAEPKCVR